MTKLTVFNYRPKAHAKDFVRLALYFNKLWQWSCGKAKNGDAVIAIHLTRLYKTLTSGKNRDLVKFVANIWFIQLSRGDNLTKKCSQWQRRPAPCFNAAALAGLQELISANQATVDEMWDVVAQKNTVEVSLKTIITLPTSEAATSFMNSVSTLLDEAANGPALTPEDVAEIEEVFGSSSNNRRVVDEDAHLA